MGEGEGLAVPAWLTTALRITAAVLGLLGALGVAVVVVSLKHRSLFDASDPAAWLWFGAFAAIAIGLATALVPTITDRRSVASAPDRAAV